MRWSHAHEIPTKSAFLDLEFESAVFRNFRFDNYTTTERIGKHSGVSEDLSPYLRNWQLPQGKPTSSLPVNCPTILTWAEQHFYDLPLIRSRWVS